METIYDDEIIKDSFHIHRPDVLMRSDYGFIRNFLIFNRIRAPVLGTNWCGQARI